MKTTLLPQYTPNQLSRRNWLRDAAIAATSAVVVPSMLISCTDHAVPQPGGGLGSEPPITEAELRSAAQNLINMHNWFADLANDTGRYKEDAFLVLDSGQKPTSWKDFAINILTALFAGIFEVIGAAQGVKYLLINPTLALASALVKQFVNPDRPENLEAVFAEFGIAHDAMVVAIKSKLLILADEKDNYKNLRDEWPGELDFNGKKYTLRDLAQSHFPSLENGTDYVELYDAALDQFKKHLWNVVFLKCGVMTNNTAWSRPAEKGSPGVKTPARYAAEEHYTDPGNVAGYLRGFYDESYFYYSNFYFEIDGKLLSAEAAGQLFKDDYPGHIINPKGLFNRDYVFKQFHLTKPDFLIYHLGDNDSFDVLSDIDSWGSGQDARCLAFNCDSNNYEFTAGGFLGLIKK